MPDFPVLRTGATAQYPLDQAVRFQTQAVEFLDGSKQRYAVMGRGLRSWIIRLDLLDDREFTAIARFIEQVANAPFLFTDPVSGESGIKCVLSGEAYDSAMRGEMTGQATVALREIL